VRTRSFMPLLIAVAALGTACADHSRLLTPPPPPPPAPGAVQLVFTRGPGDILAGYVMPPVEVAPVRASGETDPSGNITIDLDANGSGATLAGTTTARAIGGVAVFTDLRIGEPGSAVRLRAAAAGLREQLAIRGSRRSKSRHAPAGVRELSAMGGRVGRRLRLGRFRGVEGGWIRASLARGGWPAPRVRPRVVAGWNPDRFRRVSALHAREPGSV